MYILGISAYYHDSAAAILLDGEVVAAAEEERFTRRKHDSRFPENAIRFCLSAANISLRDVSYVAFYDKPWIKFERLLETYLAYAPRGFRSFVKSMPVWLKEKLYLKSTMKQCLSTIGQLNVKDLPPLLFAEHHQSHAASAFFPSPFESAAVLCLDGVGEWDTTSAWYGSSGQLTRLWSLRFPHSLGLLYSAFTQYCGFKVNSGEYKLMGLAPYGEPRFVDVIRTHLIDVKSDGTFRLNMDYFNYATGLTMTNGRFDQLFGNAARDSEGPIEQHHMDVARSIQEVTEDVILKLAATVHRETGAGNLCLAGGVALNCVANGRVLREGPFSSIWIQPAAGDSGGALGCALSVWHQYLGRERQPALSMDSMKGGYLGPSYTDEQIAAELDRLGGSYRRLPDSELYETTASLLANGAVVGWFQGRTEFGPRALGNRSILGDPRDAGMQERMNLKIKFRESFRPFAPAVLAEDVSCFFELEGASPYMLVVAGIAKAHRRDASTAGSGFEKLKALRSTIPAVTHVDDSARIQTVHRETNPRFHALLTAFKELTGCSVLVNTSFNVRGEPIVNTVEEAFLCFMRTNIDHLVIGNCVLAKESQPVPAGAPAASFDPD